jgi:hypothetical protein
VLLVEKLIKSFTGWDFGELLLNPVQVFLVVQSEVRLQAWIKVSLRSYFLWLVMFVLNI